MQAGTAYFLPFLGASMVQYIIPVYQRAYAWDQDDCRILWDDVMRAGKNDKPHFIGSVLHVPQGPSTITSMKRHLVIDGQQRLTTLSLLLEAFSEYLEADESRGAFLTDIKVPSIRKTYLFNDDDYSGDARFKLVLSQNDRDTLFSIVSRAPLPPNASDRLVDNLEYFRQRMAGKAFDPKTLWAGLQRLQVTDTQLIPEIDDAQLIFESMNSKGKPLTATDLIRNFVLMSLPDNEQTILYETYWKPIEETFRVADRSDAEFNAFIWYWLWIMVPERKPTEAEAYSEFKLFKQDVFGGTTSDLLQNLLEHANRYACLFLGQETDGRLKNAFSGIAALDVRQVRPLLMVLYERYSVGFLTKEGFVDVCGALESFLFRRAVCGRLTTGLNHFFAGVYRDIEKQADIVTYVKAMLLLHDSHMTAYFPTDEHFKEQLASRDCYNRFTKRAYLLEKLENSYHPKYAVRVGSEVQIEHIMPQSIATSPEWKEALGVNWEEIHDRCCNCIGNLTLTNYNPELSNKPFGVKLSDPEYGFANSPYSLNSYIRNQAEWGEDQITERASILAEKAVSIWKYPQVDKSVIDSLKPKKGTKESMNWTIEEHHPWLAEGGPCRGLFEAIAQRITDTHPDWEMYVAKYYVGYRSGTGKHSLKLALMARVGGGGRIALCLPRSVDDLHDPLGLCSDKRPTGGIGPGCPTFVNYTSVTELDNIMTLINQC